MRKVIRDILVQEEDHQIALAPAIMKLSCE